MTKARFTEEFKSVEAWELTRRCGPLIESIVLGDGGKRHTATLKLLVDAGANVNIPDGNGATPLSLARNAGYTAMVRILEAAGARP